jgi:sec-independent protein translocase protein TatB
MLGLGWTEMMVIGVVALIVIGPKDLPVVMGRIGKFVGQIRRMGNEFQREINRTTGLDEVRNLRNSITSPLKKTADEIRREFNTMTPTGPKPSGAIKPADPQAESVVDELRTAAGMPATKSNDQLASEYGFKQDATPTAPVKAAPVTVPKPAVPAPTAPVTSAELAPIPEAVPVKKVTTRKAPAKAAATKTATVRKATAKVDALPDADAAAGVIVKPARKPRAPKPVLIDVPAANATPPVKKPRAPRKKPDEPAGTI